MEVQHNFHFSWEDYLFFFRKLFHDIFLIRVCACVCMFVCVRVCVHVRVCPACLAI